jgi:excisionase family DNA binding protein
MPNENESFIDLPEAARYLGCHPVTLNRKAKEGKIVAYKRFSRWMFKKSDLNALFVSNKKTA